MPPDTDGWLVIHTGYPIKFVLITQEIGLFDMALKEQLLELGLEEVMVMDGYDDCVIGVLERFGTEPIILYDKDKVIEKLVADGLTLEEAVEFYEYNQLGSWVGDRTPGFLVRLPTDNQYPTPSASVN